MICYMPFTHLEDREFTKLSGLLGAIGVYAPAQKLVPDHMMPWVQQELLDIRYPEGVDGDQLLSAVRDYKSWADLHQGNIGDMAGFFKSRKGRFPMVEDTHPTQIGNQVRHYGEPSVQDDAEPLFKAALFLAMAQEYDLQHQTMARDMNAVDSMEHRMLEQLSGDCRAGHELLPNAASQGPSDNDDAFTLYMIPQRLQAWAEVALSRAALPMLYLTKGKAVFDHVQELFPDAVELLNLELCPDRDGSRRSPADLRDTIQSLACEPDPEPRLSQTGGDADPLEGREHLAVFALIGVTPRRFLAALSGREHPAAKPDQADGRAAHTLIGLVERG